MHLSTLFQRGPFSHEQFDKNHSNVLVHDDARQLPRVLASMMDCKQSTIVRRLYSMGKAQ